MDRQRKTKNIFADKATLVLRKMLSHPDEKWVVRDFTGPCGLSLGMAQGILEAMEKQGFVERIKKGPASFAVLRNKEKLIEEWLGKYQFAFNDVYTYYNPDKSALKKIKDYFKGDRYALALHTGANMITSYVKTADIYLYISDEFSDKDMLDLRQKLNLKELKAGGNVHFIRPFYKHSVFFNTQDIKDYRIVSSLQLYLDLYNFQPRGREHAEYLKKLLEEKGKKLD